jgi:hypothetical protein
MKPGFMSMTWIAAGAMAIVVALADSASAQPAADTTTDCSVTNLMPAFWPYWEAARDAGPDDQLRLFNEMLRVPNAMVYDGILNGLPISPEELVPRAMQRTRPFEATMRELSGRIDAELPRQLESFRQYFPDFQCTTPVYFLFSAGAFDGAVRQIGGRTALLFGLDVIARIHGNLLSPLFVHELFHVHQRAVAPVAPEKLYWAVWQEGLATYVSRQLNPDVSESSICCLPDVPAVTAAMPTLIPDLLSRLDSEQPEDYARYLLGGATDIPARSGYYFGYRVAAELAKDRSLHELALLQPEVVRPLMEASLRTVH